MSFSCLCCVKYAQFSTQPNTSKPHRGENDVCHQPMRQRAGRSWQTMVISLILQLWKNTSAYVDVQLVAQSKTLMSFIRVGDGG